MEIKYPKAFILKVLLLLLCCCTVFLLGFEYGVKLGEFERPEEITQPKELTHYFRNIGEFRLTAYCSCPECCGKWANNRPTDERGNEIVYGASGEILTEGISIAVDPDVIPYGSIVEINGNKYRADDTGGAIKGSRIDVYFADHEQAKQFGVQYADVFIKVKV